MSSMNRPYKQTPSDSSERRRAGHTGIHKDMSGKVIGGYDQSGAAYGTKVGLQGHSSLRSPSQGPQGQQSIQEPQQSSATEQTGGTKPATGYALRDRLALKKEMETVGYEKITPEMREKARSMGVADADFNRVASQIKENEAYAGYRKPEEESVNSGKQQTSTTQQRQYKAAPSAPKNVLDGPTNRKPTKWEQDRAKRIADQNALREKGVNPLTNLPMGTKITDEAYKNRMSPEQALVKEQMREENNKRILAEHYAKTGQPDPRGVQPVSRPYKTAMPNPVNKGLPTPPKSGGVNPVQIAATIKPPSKPVADTVNSDIQIARNKSRGW